MNQQSTTTSPVNGASMPHDLFALTDEQILEIEPEAADPAPVGQPFLAVQEHAAEPQAAKTSSGAVIPERTVRSDASQNAQPGLTVPQEPPPWLAAQMKDPWSGEEARGLWNGVQQARQEAAAYRAAFATPEDARALKELYPGGVNEARAAAERARTLDDIDRAYFGAAGGTPEQTSAARGELAQRMLREDPAAFREMVFAGLRALEAAGNQAGAFPVRATLASPAANGGNASAGGASPSPTTSSVVGAQSVMAGAPANGAPAHEAQLATYSAFEKAANEDLERNVGATIERTLVQALPNLKANGEGAKVGARYIVPLHERLNTAIRQDVEAALKGDRQLGEQVAQILSARRLDNETRSQVVRLIGERAQQLVPIAAKRVLNDWTQTTLAAHRGQNARAEAASVRREVAPASSDSRSASLSSSSPGGSKRAQSQDPNRGAARSDPRRVDYHKLSDEQILDL